MADDNSDDKKPLRLATEQEAAAKRRDDNLKKVQAIRDDYQIDKMDERLVTLLIDYPGIPKSTLARMLGVTNKTIYNRLKKPALVKALADMQKNGLELIEEVQTAAVRRVRQLIRSKDEKIALDASKFVLMPMFNQATFNVTQTEEKIHRVQFGEGGNIFTTVELSHSDSKRLSPLELVEQAEKEGVPLDQVIARHNTDDKLKNLEKKTP